MPRACDTASRQLWAGCWIAALAVVGALGAVRVRRLVALDRRLVPLVLVGQCVVTALALLAVRP
ncbi:hypothetical protein [Cellulomonas fimi]|uniref:hypothetical protein n=1 Tax=Cellulomonas fimi TaxID=1708 RepID=UPI000F83AA2A|nr:hypothetical protein [Cellulomonas fimi]NNH05889.1 hypothetical protein [Cellulomonas fimi]